MGEESDRDEETSPDVESAADEADAADRSVEDPSDGGEAAAESGDSESAGDSDAASDTDDVDADADDVDVDDADGDAADDVDADDADADEGVDTDGEVDAGDARAVEGDGSDDGRLTTVVGEPTEEERAAEEAATANSEDPPGEDAGEQFSLDDTLGPPTEADLEAAREEAPPLSREEAEAARAEREAAQAEAEAESATPPAESDGGATAAGVSVDRPSRVDEDDEVGEGLLGDGPEYDEEMPLADHIEEMMRRLGVVFLIAGVVTLVFYPLSPDLINYLWGTHIPVPTENRPRLYGPLEFILTRLKVAGLAGLILGLPVFVYQTYRFMKPGLYPHERRYYLASIPTSLVLGIVGVLFAHFIVLPAIFSYFTAYTTGTAVIAFGLKETFNLILIMMAYMAIVFQIPLFIMLAIMMNLVTRRWLEEKRLLFWGAFLGISFIASPDPTGMAPIIVTATMIVLYEGTLALLRWTGN